MDKTCCFIGHRTVEKGEQWESRLLQQIEEMICRAGVDTFLFGSKSEFDTLCLDLMNRMKEKYPHIKRIYVRAEYPDIDEGYRRYLLQWYEETYFPEKIKGAGRAVYVERNYEMIDRSRYCIFYYDEKYSSDKHKSGTEIALEYARQKKKEIIYFP